MKTLPFFFQVGQQNGYEQILKLIPAADGQKAKFTLNGMLLRHKANKETNKTDMRLRALTPLICLNHQLCMHVFGLWQETEVQ